MSDTESISTINEDINEDIEVADGEPTKSLQKPKKPRTEAQIKALEKAQLKRAENIEKRKQEKEIKKLEKEQEKLNKKKASIINEDIDTEDLIKQNEDLLKKLALSKATDLKNINKKPKQKKPVKQTIIYESESSETEEEEIIIKKKPKHKKKATKKKVVYESESSEEEEEPVITKKLQKLKSVKPQYEEEQYYEPPAPRQRLKYSDVFRFQ